MLEVHGPAEKLGSKEAAEHHVLGLAKTLIDKFVFRSIVWLTVAITGSCTVIALLAGYV